MRTDTLPFRPAARPAPDPAFAARPGLLRLRDDLRAAAAVPPPPRGWKEAPVFFFDPARQAELDAARGPNPPAARHPLDARIAAELPGLVASVAVRHAARAISGLREAAAELAGRLPAAKDLADLLAVPDDEVVAVHVPGRGACVRVQVRGVADVAGLHAVLADLAPDLADDPPADPGAARWQFYRPAAVAADGSLPEGFAGYAHWLWPAQPLATVARRGGERVVYAGPPAFPASLEVEERFPGLVAEGEVIGVTGRRAVPQAA